MNFLTSKSSFVSTLIRGALDSLRADYNNVTIRNGCSRIIAKRRPPHMRWPGYRYRFKDGKEYYGFTYYPNSRGEVDPEWQPTELFMVKRKTSYGGNPYWEKRLLKYFHLDGKKSAISICMNDEKTNKKLWQIKHLVEITPITFPNGYPQDGDLSRCRLYENGEFRIDQTFEPDVKSYAATEFFQKHPEGPTKHVLEWNARQKWTFPMSNDGFHI